MADTRVSDLASGGAFVGTDIFYVVELAGIGGTQKTVTQLEEFVQDVVGAQMTDTATIDFIYNDTTGAITADVKAASIDATHLDPTARPTFAGILLTDDVDIDFTATENDQHALEIDCINGNFSDVKALDIFYDTGTLAVMEIDVAVLISIDETSATGGEVCAFEVVATTGLARAVGTRVGVGIDPLEHFSGAFGDAGSILVLAVDQTTALSSGGAGNITVFSADDDTITIGGSAKFEEIECIIDTPASGSGIAPTFEFSTGVGTWDTFSPTDGTNGFRNTGIIIFDDALIPTWVVGAGSEFLIRITRTRNSLGTAPILDLIQIAGVTIFGWDEDANIDVNSVTINGTSTPAINTSGHVELRSYAVASLPSAATAAQMIYVTDETGGAIPAFSDGTNWRRVSDRAVVA